MARVKPDERRLAAMLASPVAWGEAYLRNRDGKPRRYWPHQQEDARHRREGQRAKTEGRKTHCE